MKHYYYNNYLKFLFLGDTSDCLQNIHQLVHFDLLPLQMNAESDLNKATELLENLDRDKQPQVIVLNIDSPIREVVSFLEYFKVHFATQSLRPLFYITGNKSDEINQLLFQRFPFINNFVDYPIDRTVIEQIVSQLLIRSENSFQLPTPEMA